MANLEREISDPANRAPMHPIGVYFHLPKTAGTTLHHIIVREYDREAVFQTPMAPHAVEAWQQTEPRVQRQTRFITGHMFLEFCDALNHDFDLITLLRDPVERVVSGYYHLCRHPELKSGRKVIDNNLSLEQCLDELQPVGLDNMYARRLSGIDRKGKATPFGQCGSDHLRRALDHLASRFTLVGLTEKFDRSLLMFAHHFGWKRPYYCKENVGANRAGTDAVPLHVIRKIEKLNELDREIYEFGRKLFHREQARQRITFSFKLRCFQAGNTWRQRLKPVGRFLSIQS